MARTLDEWTMAFLEELGESKDWMEASTLTTDAEQIALCRTNARMLGVEE